MENSEIQTLNNVTFTMFTVPSKIRNRLENMTHIHEKN